MNHKLARNVATVIALLFAAGVVIMILPRSSRVTDKEAIATALTWARLESLSTSAQNVTVEILGSPFSHEFIVTFDAPAGDLQEWLRSSPGTSASSPKTADGMTIYSIEPGDGAQFAEVRIDESTGRVIINTYWS